MNNAVVSLPAEPTVPFRRAGINLVVCSQTVPTPNPSLHKGDASVQRKVAKLVAVRKSVVAFAKRAGGWDWSVRGSCSFLHVVTLHVPFIRLPRLSGVGSWSRRGLWVAIHRSMEGHGDVPG